MKAVVLFSGGMDSTTLIYYLLDQGEEVYPISFNYGQRHQKELEYARRLTDHLDLPHEIINLTDITRLMSKSSLTSEDIPVPHGHYQDESMRSTVVPNRNMILISIAVAYAVNIEADMVCLAIHSGDHAIYPDCTPDFYDMMRKAVLHSNYKPIVLYAPFLNISKMEIARLGHQLNVPYDMTWTCYEGGPEPCGKCGACVERQEALHINPEECDYNE